MPTDAAKGRCPICLRPEPFALRKDGTLREHKNRAGTRPCGGTGQDPMPDQRPEVGRRDLAVLDGLLGEQGGGDDA